MTDIVCVLLPECKTIRRFAGRVNNDAGGPLLEVGEGRKALLEKAGAREIGCYT